MAVTRQPDGVLNYHNAGKVSIQHDPGHAPAACSAPPTLVPKALIRFS
jgi:hypothetical protein